MRVEALVDDISKDYQFHWIIYSILYQEWVLQINLILMIRPEMMITCRKDLLVNEMSLSKQIPTYQK